VFRQISFGSTVCGIEVLQHPSTMGYGCVATAFLITQEGKRQPLIKSDRVTPAEFASVYENEARKMAIAFVHARFGEPGEPA
jgi:hypothetical protein